MVEKRRTRGRKTAADYANRIGHVLDFVELRQSKNKWPLARNIDRDFVITLSNFLYTCDVTPNGRDGARCRKMAPKMVRSCLETLRAALNWAKRPDVRNLPPDFINPVSDEILGPKPTKDPLRPNPVPLTQRVAIVETMDSWQLLNLVVPLVLPVRFEDVTGALVSDFDLEHAKWRIGDRFNGNDATKSRLTMHMPLPPELVTLLRVTIGN